MFDELFIKEYLEDMRVQKELYWLDYIIWISSYSSPYKPTTKWG